MISYITTEVRKRLWSKTGITVRMLTRLYTFHSKTLVILLWEGKFRSLIVLLSDLEGFSELLLILWKKSGVFVVSEDAAKASCCPWHEKPLVEASAAKTTWGQVHHCLQLVRARHDGQRCHSSTQLSGKLIVKCIYQVHCYCQF